MTAPAVKVALVTGSGKRRVGWHVAEALARRGYHIGVHYHTSAAEAAQTVEHLKQLGVEAIPLRADLTDDAAVRGVVDQTLKHFGRLDVLVNCAAAYRSKRFEDVTAGDVRFFFE